MIRKSIILVSISLFIAIGYAQNISDLEVTFAGTRDGQIEFDSLLNNQKLIINDTTFSIRSFYMSISSEGISKEYYTVSGRLNSEMKKAIKNTKTNDKVYFDRIKVSHPTGSLYSVNAIRIIIK